MKKKQQNLTGKLYYETSHNGDVLDTKFYEDCTLFEFLDERSDVKLQTLVIDENGFIVSHYNTETEEQI